MIRRILVGLANAEHADSATKTAIGLARIHQAELTGISVLDVDRLGATGPVPIGAGEAASELREHRITEAKKTIQEILTLRYSKNWSNSYPSLSSNDFIEGISITDPEKFIEDSIQREIREKIGTGQTNVGIALSSGIDSTLVLALTRKEFPSINIETVSVKFSNSVDET